jgi:hypothetical protein
MTTLASAEGGGSPFLAFLHEELAPRPGRLGSYTLRLAGAHFVDRLIRQAQQTAGTLRHCLRAVDADTRACYVVFRCADGFFTSIDMESALRPQTILALDFLGAPLTAPFGAPVRLRIPTKLGFKNPKSIIAMEVTNKWTAGCWANQGYNWFSGS